MPKAMFYSRRHMVALLLSSSLTLGALGAQAQTDSASQYADRLYSKMTGLHPNPETTEQLAREIRNGNYLGAAQIVSDDPNFIVQKVRDWAGYMDDKDSNPNTENISDIQLLLLGIYKDEKDSRELMYSTYKYAVGPQETYSGDDSLADPEGFVAKLIPYQSKLKEPAGVLTTNSFAKQYYSAGTNRRAYKYAFEKFLCTPISALRILSPSHDVGKYVRQDVDRVNGGNLNIFREQCSGCHNNMDATAGAFALLDSTEDGKIVELDSVAPKYHQNATIFPEGNYTVDNHWVNLGAKLGYYDALGFYGALEGEGVNSLGKSLAMSKAFDRCMAQTVYEVLCSKKYKKTDFKTINDLANQFGQDNYNLKKLFQRVMLSPQCGV